VVSFSLTSTDLHSWVTLASGVVRLGPLRVSGYSLCAAVGLLAALWLSQRTAKLAGLSAESLWDAGIFTVAAAFVISRLLLIARDAHAFLRYPLLILALPSFTYLGMALTTVATLVYLRRHKLPLLRVLDAWAPCAALLAAALSLGHWVEGSDEGMPTRLPWGVASPIGRVHPVQLYAVVAALALGAALLRLLLRQPRTGIVAAVALLAGGLIVFRLEMITQPDLTAGWLEPGQWIAVASMLAGIVLGMSPQTRQEAN
jgi:phosphatidylglycerol:prolipoprotein diacylglycerol transferase